jgi:translation elongation factor EF-1beta
MEDAVGGVDRVHEDLEMISGGEEKDGGLT